MNTRFQLIVDKMEPLLEQLKGSEIRNRRNLKGIPAKGVYVFYEHGKPIYVGRSNRLRDRILEHSRPSSTQGSATFAFKLTQEELDIPIGHAAKDNRQQLEQDDVFDQEYSKQKKRVSDMPLRVVDIEDQATQMIFEAYAILALETTHYNRFETT